jgi:hypothetical protein
MACLLYLVFLVELGWSTRQIKAEVIGVLVHAVKAYGGTVL